MKSRVLLLLTSVLIAVSLPLRAVEEKKTQEPTSHQKVYYFEHRLLPKWAHGTKGEFFSDLSKGTLDRILGAATDLVGKDFAQKLTVRALPGTAQVLISFQEPSEPPLCFFALVEKSGETYRYFTLEFTEDLLGDGTKSVYGEWDEQGGHRNLGPRKYSDAESFIADIPKT